MKPNCVRCILDGSRSLLANPGYYVAALDCSGKKYLHHYPGVTKHKYFLFIVSCIVNLGKQ